MTYPQAIFTEQFTAMVNKMPQSRFNAVLSVLLWILNIMGSIWAKFVGFTDWSLFGWAFAGATVFVLSEMLQKPPIVRTGRERAYLAAIGIAVGLALNTWVSGKLDMPVEGATFLLSAFGYYLQGVGKKWIQKSSGDDKISDRLIDKLLDDKTPPGDKENV